MRERRHVGRAVWTFRPTAKVQALMGQRRKSVCIYEADNDGYDNDGYDNDDYDNDCYDGPDARDQYNTYFL